MRSLERVLLSLQTGASHPEERRVERHHSLSTSHPQKHCDQGNGGNSCPDEGDVLRRPVDQEDQEREHDGSDQHPKKSVHPVNPYLVPSYLCFANAESAAFSLDFISLHAMSAIVLRFIQSSQLYSFRVSKAFQAPCLRHRRHR